MTPNEIVEDALNKWHANRCVGTMYIRHPVDPRAVLIMSLQKIYNKSPSYRIAIIVPDNYTRAEITNYLTHQNSPNDVGFKKLIDEDILRIFTITYAVENYKEIEGFPLVIYYKFKRLTYPLDYVLERVKFKLVIITELLKTPIEISTLYKHCPTLDCFRIVDIDGLRLQTPVEKIEYVVSMDANDYSKYTEYSDYIGKSLSIFGQFENIDKCRQGDGVMSSFEFCKSIATYNGWSEDLDMSFEFNRQIDESFNPNTIYERSILVYDIIRKRNALVAGNNAKLDAILDIVSKNTDKKILILSKSGEFANSITEKLLANGILCGNAHNKAPQEQAKDDYGNFILVKSGPNKGAVKMLGCKAIETRNVIAFNNKDMIALSATESINPEITIDVDVIIITSAMCKLLKDFLLRLVNLKIKSTNLKYYVLFCADTIEQNKAQSRNDSYYIVNTDSIIFNNVNFDNNTENNVEFVWE